MKAKKFNETLHRELWSWLAGHPTAKKADWPKWDGIEEQRSNCFACEYAWDREGCEDCPLVWPDNDYKDKVCDEAGGLWSKWECSRDLDERSALARQIAELPVKPGVVTE